MKKLKTLKKIFLWQDSQEFLMMDIVPASVLRRIVLTPSQRSMRVINLYLI